jgi:hypothetical protein
VSLSEHRYIARIAPCSSSAADAIHDGASCVEDGRRVRESIASGCLTWPLETVPILLCHDDTKRVGFVSELAERDGWWEASFVLDMDRPLSRVALELLHVGAPVSIGMKSLQKDEQLANLGTATPIHRHTKAVLEEVSIVEPPFVAAYAGAKVTRIIERENPLARLHRRRQERERAEAKLTRTPTPKAQPKQQAKPQPAVATVYRRRTVTDAEWRQEYERRLDWIERTTGLPAEPDVVLRGLRREIEGPTLDELYAETIGRRRVA